MKIFFVIAESPAHKVLHRLGIPRNGDIIPVTREEFVSIENDLIAVTLHKKEESNE